MAPQELKKIVSSSIALSLRAAIFHTLAFKMSNEEVTNPTKRSFLKVLNSVCKFKKKNINFEQYARIHLMDPKLAYANETVSETVFVLNSKFTSKDDYFRLANDEACDAFNKTARFWVYAKIRNLRLKSSSPSTTASILLKFNDHLFSLLNRLSLSLHFFSTGLQSIFLNKSSTTTGFLHFTFCQLVFNQFFTTGLQRPRVFNTSPGFLIHWSSTGLFVIGTVTRHPEACNI